MKDLRNSLVISFFTLLISACQSMKSFHLETMKDSNEELHIIRTNSDRIQQKCLFLNAEGDNNWRHQYFMYILNNENQVMEVMESTHMDGDFCRAQFDAIEKLLKSEPQVKACVRDKIRRSKQCLD